MHDVTHHITKTTRRQKNNVVHTKKTISQEIQTCRRRVSVCVCVSGNNNNVINKTTSREMLYKKKCCRNTRLSPSNGSVMAAVWNRFFFYFKLFFLNLPSLRQKKISETERKLKKKIHLVLNFFLFFFSNVISGSLPIKYFSSVF